MQNLFITVQSIYEISNALVHTIRLIKPYSFKSPKILIKSISFCKARVTAFLTHRTRSYMDEQKRHDGSGRLANDDVAVCVCGLEYDLTVVESLRCHSLAYTYAIRIINTAINKAGGRR